MYKIICGHGLGDCLLGFQVAHFLEQKDYTDICVSTRQEIFEPLQYLFQKQLNKQTHLYNIPPQYSEDNAILYNNDLLKQLLQEIKCRPHLDKFYYVIPDLLFRNPYAANDIGIAPHVIKSTRVLLNRRQTPNKLIYCGLQTTTKNYHYHGTANLLKRLATELPDYTIYYPNIQSWNNEQTHYIDNEQFKEYNNILIDNNPKFIESIDVLLKSDYFIGTCNGPSHIAYHLGIPRLILDPQYGRLPWIARWKEDTSENISNTINYIDVCEVVKTNILDSSTTLIPRIDILRNVGVNWKDCLLYKF